MGFRLLPFLLLTVNLLRCLSLTTRRFPKSGCKVKVDGCESNLEVLHEGECVMADKLSQYPQGEDIHATISNFERMMTAYYGGDTSNIKNVMNISDSARSVLVEKLRKAISDDKKFVVAALGSSVTAAHDNCFIDGYPTQLESLLKPMFKQIGVNFESRNVGIGGSCGDSFFDQVPCMAQVVGDDADVTSFSWDYWQDNPEFQEHFIRTSLTLPRKAMPLLITLNMDHYPTHDKFSRLYSQLGYHAIAATSNTVTRHVPSRDAESKKKFGYCGDGFQRMTRIGGKYPDGHCRRESTSYFWRNWHGGPMLYQNIADAMAWQYVQALKEAIEPSSQQHSLQPPGLPDGLISKVMSPPKCISFNKPNAADTWNAASQRSSFIALRNDMSEGVEVELSSHRKEMLPAAEVHEDRCQHADICGVVKGEVVTLDLHADVETGDALKPLPLGKLVVCIGGGPPPKPAQLLEPSFNVSSEWKTFLNLPPPPVFPRCSKGALESIKVDGHSLDLLRATKWAETSEGASKCGVFELEDKSARLVNIRSGACGLTHVFAM
jgi:hypothetical protein